MTRHRSFSELAFAGDTQDPNLPVEWARGAAVQILMWMWKSFDQFRSEYLRKIDLNQSLEQLERDLTRNHFLDLQAVFQTESEGFPSFYPEYEWPEFESRSSSQAKPPAYDFAFVHFEHRRWAWPIEAKVLATPGTWHEYMKDVHEKYETGIAAPLVADAGMIGYLISGSVEDASKKLQAQFSVPLEAVPEFGDRAHKMSNHERNPYPTLRLHHMIMVCN